MVQGKVSERQPLYLLLDKKVIFSHVDNLAEVIERKTSRVAW